MVTNCSEGGVVGPVVGVIGTMQAVEILKVIGKVGGWVSFFLYSRLTAELSLDSLDGRLFIYDAFGASTRTVKLRNRNPSCAVCG